MMMVVAAFLQPSPPHAGYTLATAGPATMYMSTYCCHAYSQRSPPPLATVQAELHSLHASAPNAPISKSELNQAQNAKDDLTAICSSSCFCWHADSAELGSCWGTSLAQLYGMR